MAEFVEFRMQEMLPVLEKITQTGLLTDKKLKAFISTLQEREFKIQRPGRTWEDFVNYFTVLKSMLGILKIQREKLRYFHHENEIEERIRALIMSRFGMANRNFKHQLAFWEYQITFLKGMNWLERVSDIYTEVTNLHGVKHPNLWVEASNYEWARKPGDKGIGRARQLIQLGIRKHQSLLLLYIQGFYLELKYVEHVRSIEKLRKQMLELENGKSILEDFALARTFYNLSKTQCKAEGPKLNLEFYRAIKPFEFAVQFMKEIESDLIDDHSENELAYDLAAKIKLSEIKGQDEDVHTISNGFEIYGRGLRTRPTVQMYDYYLATLQLLYGKLPQPALKKMVRVELISVFEKAHGNMKLSEKGYVNWYSFIQKLESEDSSGHYTYQCSSSQILKIGLDKFPGNGGLIGAEVRKRLELFENSQRVEPATRVELSKLSKGVKALLKKTCTDSFQDPSIWTSVFLYLISHVNSTSKILQKFIVDVPPAAAADLKYIYIKHLSYTDIDRARSYYQENCFSPGISLKFHLEMAKLDVLSVKDIKLNVGAFKHAETCYENAARGFGKRDIDVWLSYLSFLRNVSKDEKNARMVYSLALIQLEGSLVEDFINAERKLGRPNNKRAFSST